MPKIHYLINDFKKFIENAKIEGKGEAFERYYLVPNKSLIAPLLNQKFLRKKDIYSVLKETDLEFYRRLIKKLELLGYPERAKSTVKKAENLLGRSIRGNIILLFTIGGEEGITVYENGEPNIYIGLDYPQEKEIYFDLVLAHELGHAARDTIDGVMEVYGGNINMGHSELLSITPFEEHVIGEGIATYFSEAVYPDYLPQDYLFYEPWEYEWCKSHELVIWNNFEKARGTRGNLSRFYKEGSLGKGSPGRTDYYLGYTAVKGALKKYSFNEILGMEASKVISFFKPSLL
jgi:hypothetical protein